MKKTNLLLIALLLVTGASAQIPQALNYQAIARNSTGQIIPSQNIGVRFSITDAPGNTVFYQETHNATTNAFGLFTLAIGKGTAVSGAIAPIDWSTGGDKYLKVEIAPQGGTNYTIQGTTQLLSVPYALYAEKTRLIAGTGITIINGNMISANYQAGNAITITGNTIAANYLAGPGINITGNTISATAANAWLLNGNAGTSAANFLGTTDNLALRFRVNNSERFSISPITAVGTYNVSYLTAGDPSPASNNPSQFSVHGKDISGSMLPFGVNASVIGMTWSQTGGSNNTLGRLVRWAQWTSNTNNQFYDQGIDQEGDYYVTEQGLSGTGGSFPRKMLQISATDNVGINMDWAENPTANFHTKGTLRFEGVNTNNTLTRILAMDVNGNVSSRDASTLTGASNDWSLTGNSGTTAASFLGTIDNQRLNFRTNNITRMYLDQSIPAFGADLGHLSLSSETDVLTRPTQLSVFGRDIAGGALPGWFVSYVGGATWGIAGGNTLGRHFRLSQMSTNVVQSHFYDFGMSQDSSFYITNHGFQNVGGIMPKKMFTISAQDMIGINLDMSEKPTAVLHTKGSLRFQNINTNNTLTRIVAMDANGNVSSRDASTITGSNLWVPDANGIHNSAGNVGVGMNSQNNTTFSIMGSTSSSYTTEINSANTWQTTLNLFNSTSIPRWYMVTGGSSNTQATYGVGAGNFGIANDSLSSPSTTFPIIITPDDKVGIGMGLGGSNNVPKSQLHIKTGDVYIEQIGSGVIMKSPDGQCWRMTVSNAGTPVFTAITCP